MRIRALAAGLLFGPVLAVGGPVVVESDVALACSCADPADRIAEMTAGSAAVFVGRLSEVRRPEVRMSSLDESRFVFEVDTVYKGEVRSRQSIVSASDGASCGLELSVGDTGLVFARTADPDLSPEGGEYVSSLCEVVSGPGAATLAEAIGPGAEPLPGSSPIGADDGLPSTVVRNWYWFAAVFVGGVTFLGWLGRRRRAEQRAAWASDRPD